MKKYINSNIWNVFAIIMFATISQIIFASCSDDEEEKEKIFTFAADGTPELVGNNGLDFNTMYAALKGKMIDDSSTRDYAINPDGSLTFLREWSNWELVSRTTNNKPTDIKDDYGALSRSQINGINFPIKYRTLYWGEDGLYMVKINYFYAKWLNYPTNAQEEVSFFKRYDLPYLCNCKIVKYRDGKIGVVRKQPDGSWVYMDNITVFSDDVAAKMWELTPLEFGESLGDRWNGKPYRDPEL